MARNAPTLTIRLAIVASIVLTVAIVLLLGLAAFIRGGGCWACGG